MVSGIIAIRWCNAKNTTIIDHDSKYVLGTDGGWIK